MDLAVDEALPSEIDTLRNLGELYAYDFSEILGLDLRDDGRFGHDFWRGAWTPARTPYLFRVDGRLAGFAILVRGSRITGDPDVNDVGELFVVRRYRRAGIGTLAATRLFRSRPGAWEVRQRTENEAARAFWHHAIRQVTGGPFEETLLDDERWRGWVQRFNIGAESG